MIPSILSPSMSFTAKKQPSVRAGYQAHLDEVSAKARKARAQSRSTENYAPVASNRSHTGISMHGQGVGAKLNYLA